MAALSDEGLGLKMTRTEFRLHWPAVRGVNGAYEYVDKILRDADPDAKLLFKTYPSEDEPGLRVFVASPLYLFAMKCLAMRIGGVDESQDRSDIEALAREIGISTAEQALDIVSQYYPLSRISPKTHYGIHEIFSGLSRASDPKS
jgi:hypothetical protein